MDYESMMDDLECEGNYALSECGACSSGLCEDCDFIREQKGEDDYESWRADQEE
jgi:hypothetical protein